MARELVNWNGAYSTGIPEIDRQHRWLFDLLNQVWERIIVPGDREKLLEVLDRLEQYTLAHFTAEEAYMTAIAYPAFLEHKRMHRHFVKRISDERAAVQNGGKLTLSLLEFLKQWLLNHIMRVDKDVAAHARKFRQEKQQEKVSAQTNTEDEDESVLKIIFKQFI